MQHIPASNPICTLFAIRFPLIQAGMVWCSGWELTSAVSNAGGLGLIGAGSMDPDTLRIHIRKCQAATAHPFGVNVPLLYRHAPELLRVVIEEGVRIVFSSAGNPKTHTAMLQSEGVCVAHVVASSRFARKAEDAGVDAVVAEGFEAGGHNGREETTTFCLLPQVRAAVSLPLIAAGGIADGAGMMAALSLGADAVQIGSRFVASEESCAHPRFKEAVIQAQEGSTQLQMKALTPVRLLDNTFAQDVRAAESAGASVEALSALLGRGRARKGMFEGDTEQGELEIGQIASNLHQVLPAAEIVQRIIAEYNTLRQQVGQGGNRFQF